MLILFSLVTILYRPVEDREARAVARASRSFFDPALLMTFLRTNLFLLRYLSIPYFQVQRGRRGNSSQTESTPPGRANETPEGSRTPNLYRASLACNLQHGSWFRTHWNPAQAARVLFATIVVSGRLERSGGTARADSVHIWLVHISHASAAPVGAFILHIERP